MFCFDQHFHCGMREKTAGGKKRLCYNIPSFDLYQCVTVIASDLMHLFGLLQQTANTSSLLNYCKCRKDPSCLQI